MLVQGRPRGAHNPAHPARRSQSGAPATRSTRQLPRLARAAAASGSPAGGGPLRLAARRREGQQGRSRRGGRRYCAWPSAATKACSARSIARPSAALLFTVSSHSDSGTESATRPAPACGWAGMSGGRRWRRGAASHSGTKPVEVGACGQTPAVGAPRNAAPPSAATAWAPACPTQPPAPLPAGRAHLQVHGPLAARPAAGVAVERVVGGGGDDHGAQRQRHVHAACGWEAGGGEGQRQRRARELGEQEGDGQGSEARWAQLLPGPWSPRPGLPPSGTHGSRLRRPGGAPVKDTWPMPPP